MVLLAAALALAGAEFCVGLVPATTGGCTPRAATASLDSEYASKVLAMLCSYSQAVICACSGFVGIVETTIFRRQARTSSNISLCDWLATFGGSR